MSGDAAARLTVYVYFRSGHEAVERARAALARQRELVGRRLGLDCRIALRHDRDKPYLTWLEVYEGVDPGELAQALEGIDRASTDSGLAALALEGRRHEVFAPQAPA